MKVINKSALSLVGTLLVGECMHSVYSFSSSLLSPQSSKTSSLSESKQDLEALAKKLNPAVPYWDPLGLVNENFWYGGEESTIGWLRQAEIKHGRVAMAAFVGYCVQSNYHFDIKETLAGASFPSTDLPPEAQWEALPTAAKWQILLLVGFLEVWDECGGLGELPHYTQGRQPGKYPTFENFRKQIHYTPDLFNPLNIQIGKKTPEEIDEGLTKELNNGRLAMIGIMGCLAADKVEGSVPALTNVARHFEGNSMGPFMQELADGRYPDVFWNAFLAVLIFPFFFSAVKQDFENDRMGEQPAE